MELTEEEEKRLAEFRPRVESLLKAEYAKTDLYLIRWLRARDLKVDAAEEMLKTHIKWREVNKIDLLLQGSPDSYFAKNYPYWLNGIDLKGQPVLCSPVGDWDIRKIVEEDRIKEFEDYVNRMYERILEAIRKCNDRKSPDQPPITQFTLILNWDKFSVRQTANLKGRHQVNFVYKLARWVSLRSYDIGDNTLVNIAAVYEAHYPEILSQAFFLNTNPFFQIVFAMMKPILAPKTLSKITCYGTDRSEWEPIVREVVEEHQIPRQFGG